MYLPEFHLVFSVDKVCIFLLFIGWDVDHVGVGIN